MVEHRADIFKAVMTSRVGSNGRMDVVSRYELRVDEIKDFWRDFYIWQRI